MQASSCVLQRPRPDMAQPFLPYTWPWCTTCIAARIGGCHRLVGGVERMPDHPSRAKGCRGQRHRHRHSRLTTQSLLPQRSMGLCLTCCQAGGHWCGPASTDGHAKTTDLNHKKSWQLRVAHGCGQHQHQHQRQQLPAVCLGHRCGQGHIKVRF
jgi:hypothetical protein